MPEQSTTLPPSLGETVTVIGVSNLKSVAEQPAMLSNLSFSNTVANTNLSQQNAVANQQAMNELGVSILGKTVNKVSDLGPLEARSAVDILTNNELAQDMASLKASIQMFADKVKG
ncbi:MAG: RebB family R body protein [Opitutales bacterium]|nr:RebB family R body protein [Opitutales bacterium]